MSVSILLGLLVVLGVAALVARPLLRARQARGGDGAGAEDVALENLLWEREAALVAIRDLQQDHAMGKLSDADFADLDARLRAHAIEQLRQLDALGVADVADSEDALDQWIEQAVARARAGSDQPTPPRAGRRVRV